MRETIKNIEDLINAFENTGDNGNFFIGDYSNIEIAIYIRKQQEEIEKLNSIINNAIDFINGGKGWKKCRYTYQDKKLLEILGSDKE